MSAPTLPRGTHAVPRAGFQLNCKKLFLTYPQCELRPDRFSELLLSFFGGNLKWAILCREDHADGNRHLHGVVVLHAAIRVRGCGLLDAIADGAHGNYATVRSLKHAVRYVMKGGEYVGLKCDALEMESALWAKKSTQAALACSLLKDGKTLMEVDTELPGYVMLYMHRLREYQAWLRRCKRVASLRWSDVVFSAGMSREAVEVAGWLNGNLFVSRPFKKPQLYIYGPPNVGKTSLVMQLMEYARVYPMPMEDFYDEYDDDAYDLIFLDEFKGQKSVTFLNAWLQGSPLTVRVKGGQTLKVRNLPMIIASNYSVEEAYSGLYETNPARLDSLHTRLKVVKITSWIGDLLCVRGTGTM